MAFGFIKKVFSFGRKKVEEVGDEAPAETPLAPAEETASPTAEVSPPVSPPPAEENASSEHGGPTLADRHEEVRAERTDDDPRSQPSAIPQPETSAAKDATPDDPPEEPSPEPEAVPAGPVEEDTVPDEPETDRQDPDEPSKPESEAPRATAGAEPLAKEPTDGRESADEDLGAHPEPATPEPSAKPTEEPPPAPARGEEPSSIPSERLVSPAPPAKEHVEQAPAGKVTVARKVEPKAAVPEPAPAAEPRKPWFQRLRDGLSRSSRELRDNISGVFTKRRLDEDTLQDLEDVLIRADLGVETAMRIADTLSSGRFGEEVSDEEVRGVMATEVEKVLTPVALPLELDLSHKPHVILVVGVNGTGKTTTIGKLTAKLAEGGLSVMLAAGDTFRAAAIEQLKIWGERTGSPVVSSKLGADAAGLAWDAFEKAKEAGSDVLIIDTAGRLQNKAELMAELEKIVRVLGKHDPEAPHTVLQTVDATTGQNALNQVEIFRNVAGVNGLVMTKLDGTARGGILVSIAAKHKLPVYFIGVGEQVDDLEPFSASDFARAIAGVA